MKFKVKKLTFIHLPAIFAVVVKFIWYLCRWCRMAMVMRMMMMVMMVVVVVVACGDDDDESHKRSVSFFENFNNLKFSSFGLSGLKVCQ